MPDKSIENIIIASGFGFYLKSKIATSFKLADAEGIGSWIETDKEQNLPLYQKFGFAVKEEDTLFGVKNWFMWRDAQKK